MKPTALTRLALAAILTLFTLAATAQTTLTISNGVQKCGALANTTVTMTNRCELWVTNSTLPLSGCTINFTSADAWLFLPGVKPSAVASSTYLSQLRVNGAAASIDGNLRVVQYGQNGSVVIPHASSFRPLTAFSGAQFNGTATQLGQWTYYTGTFYKNISSFKLKRGYQAVLAQSANGRNYSKCYIAQDGDLEVGVLPATLDKQVQFIYVTPWRWTSKKGIAGDPGNSRLNLNWWYNWNLDQSSSRDLEYVAIRQNQWWPGLGQNWQSLGINTLLGYNEPDHTDQANMSVNTAISAWGDLLATGLRVGAPATTDGGRNSWLYPFLQQADAAGLRVDFVPIHYYWAHDPADPNGAASQMYSFLLDIWNNTHRPIWITEWNNGANWTDNNPWPVPTYTQQQACVSAMVNMLESTPFVERYALYNWVEDPRSLITGGGVMTSAGVTYSNLVSNLSYSQSLPDNGTRAIAQYLFASNTWDTSGYYNNGMPVGAPAFTTGHISQSRAIALDGTNSYIQLPANIAKGSAFTFAAWVRWNGGAAWQRIFDFGNDTSHYLFLTPKSGSGTLRFAINGGSGEQSVESSALASGAWQHVAVTLKGNTAVIYLNGAQVNSSPSFSTLPSAFSPARNYLGKSQFADPLFSGSLDSVEIADYAMTPAQISTLYNNAQYPSYSSSVWTNNADGVWSATNNWNGGLIANGPSRMADFSAIDLSADRTVTLDSARTIGGLRFGDATGSQNWALSGPAVLTLDGGAPNAAIIAVNQNTATISAPLSGANGLAKSGSGTLALIATNSLGGGLTVNAGLLNITNGSTTFGTATSAIGYLMGAGSLNVADSRLSVGGELQIGGSDQSGAQFIATGTATMSNATVTVGALTIARGNYLDNSISGALTLNTAATLVSTNDVIVQFAGSGLGRLALNGGNLVVGPTAGKTLAVGFWDAGAGNVDIINGNLLLENGSSIKLCCGNNSTGSNVINQLGGAVTFYRDSGVSPGGLGGLDLCSAGGSGSISAYNLQGGTLTVPQIIASSTSGLRIFNFNGGTLKATASAAGFIAPGVASAANVRNGGAIVDTSGFIVTIGQALQHSAIAGDSARDGGLTKLGAGKLTLTASNTFTGPTTIGAGTLALTGAGSVASSTAIAVSTGTTFDVSAISYTLGSRQTLSGSGSITGKATINGTLAPGTSVATLTFSTAPTLNGTTILKINNTNSPNSDRLVISTGTMKCGGVLTVINSGPSLQGGDTFQLINGAVTGSFTATNLPALDPGLAWSFNPSAGTLSVIQTVATDPTNIVYSLTGRNLLLSWPADHLGWRLQAQSNALSVGLTTNWFDVAGSDATNTFSIPLDPTNDTLFYRLVFP